ncbi:MAG: protein kinase [Marmoricola sp.]|nr:protein kinase [Marmoricola sp.]
MGAVWLAKDEVLGRQVALKRVGLFPGGSTPDLARAEREARLAAKLNHPHVVAVFDFVSDGDAQWLVMEYVEGVTLADLSKRPDALSADEAAPIIRQAAEALAAAHTAGIVHRDVKPSNILITTDGTAKITDFGIARMRADATLTQTGFMTGSPAYLAPEVASGKTATDASDVWSLGATLFQALSGRPPYDVGENVVGALYRIVHEDPPRLSNAGWLTPVLEATMATEPEARWSMAQVRDFLERGPSAMPSETTRVLAPIAPPPPSPPSPPHQRRVWPLIAGLVGVLVIALGAWAVLHDNGGSDTPGSSHPGAIASTKPTAAELDAFARDYLAEAAADPAQGFALLTSKYQGSSGGLAGYESFWGHIKSATPSNIQSDPDQLTVSYHVRYKGGKLKQDDVTLQLVVKNGHLLIDNSF